MTTKAELQTTITRLESDLTTLRKELADVPTESREHGKTIRDLRDEVKNLNDKVTNARALRNFWKAAAKLTDAQLAAQVEMINKRRLIILPNPLPTNREEIVTMLDPWIDLEETD
jgi:septal ring factor EnvC (AmiA/AmiB activator)